MLKAVRMIQFTQCRICPALQEIEAHFAEDARLLIVLEHRHPPV